MNSRYKRGVVKLAVLRLEGQTKKYVSRRSVPQIQWIKADPPVFYLWDSQEAEDLRGLLGSYLSEREDGAEPFRGLKTSESKRSV